MTDLSNDPIINAIHNQMKRGIRVALDNNCLPSAVILILSGIDAMAYLAMPPNQKDVTRPDFVKWADRYIKFPCQEQLTGWDLYGARCAMLHNFGVVSDLSRKGQCRMVGYMDKSVPEVRFNSAVSNKVVLVSVPALADAFFTGVDKFLVDAFTNKSFTPIIEKRLQKLVTAFPMQ
jgi:hypothetical protein